MGWVEHAIWWQVYPLGFCGAPIWEPDPSPRPRLRRLLGWLDYAVELGVSGLLLGPVFASRTHGYDSLDQFRVDPRLGNAEDLEHLIAACRARGLRILLDGVFSHVSADHPNLRRALHEGPVSGAAALFDINWHLAGGPEPRVFEGHSGLARLDHTAPQTVEYVIQVMSHWLARGIDGWRLDAAYAVDPTFWAQVLPRVRAHHPEAWFLGEVIHGDYTSFVTAAGVDSVTQYELWKAIWSSITDRNLFELDWALTRHNEFLEHFTPNTFIGNHDVTRIASTLGADGAVTALAILLTVGGIPAIYAGDEQGFTGIKEDRRRGDDAIRPAFPDTPDQLPSWRQDVHRAHQDLIGLRRRHPWLATAATTTVTLANTTSAYRVSARDGHDHLEVRIDLDSRPRVRIRNASGGTIWAQS